MTPDPLDPQARRRLMRRYHALRIVGFAIVAAGVALLVATESAGALAASIAMLLGAAIALAGVLSLARYETLRDHGTRKAVRLLVAGFGLKLGAIPLVALGGSWLAWGGAALPVALGVAGIGLAAYVYGIVARIDGLAMLPTGAHYA